jgi:hypothetical protein
MAFFDVPPGAARLGEQIAGDIKEALFGPRAESAIEGFFNRGYRIEFYHVPTGRAVGFKSWLTGLEDNFESEWNPESVYGRMDPIMTFQGTKRTISLGFDTLATSEDEAIENLAKVELLMSMLYPSYKKVESATSINSPPLFKVKFMNLIASGDGSVDTGGLVAAIGGFAVSPDIEGGFFGSEGSSIYPKKIGITCTMTILHTDTLGWNGENNHWSSARSLGHGFYGQSSTMKSKSAKFADQIGVKLSGKDTKGAGDTAGSGVDNQQEAAAAELSENAGQRSAAGRQTTAEGDNPTPTNMGDLPMGPPIVARQRHRAPPPPPRPPRPPGRRRQSVTFTEEDVGVITSSTETSEL